MNLNALRPEPASPRSFIACGCSRDLCLAAAQTSRLPNRSVHHRRSEETALCLLNNLLVDRLRRVVHDDRALLVVDLGVDACVADQVDDPLLAF